ncbi:N-acetyl-gamma-glutamyl-phosphate reductase [candidate division MSBL1 archaeon SCGC-AAA261D19]|uniref:N-acetyl-gamma-glutamyl-phosphate reductase n=1 Tax=candidate division MSBL1 archaeon SCGC-AAA261D19 TaxID=1698273 RepID=A0A133V8Y0_9EURY|nr:N-acetyl-gamma-glutamyl-phosphate reductase [candidate division MSBL1 archaeon SCGC-AAA261D19]
MSTAVIGVSGYTGGELLRLLINHPKTELVGVYGKKSAGKRLTELQPNLVGFEERTIEKPDYLEIGKNADVVFTATPHGIAMKFVPNILEGGAKVIDLSADYRLDDPKIYEKYYKKHESPELKAVYGLPELHRDEIKKAELVANPGCYPTAAVLSLAPLVKENMIKTDPIIIDAKSGTSGAGAKPSKMLHHPACAENIQAYSPTSHRHEPEIAQEIGKLVEDEVGIHFTPHLIPIVRGILSTSHVFMREPSAEEEVLDLYQKFYKNEIFVRVLKALPQVSSVVGSNLCDIGLKSDAKGERFVVISVIDNLIKGASGQAIQNMNLMFGFGEAEGLGEIPLSP